MTDENINYSLKEHLVDEFSVRWFYALPAWPPANFDYDTVLHTLGLRRVDYKNFKAEIDVDPDTGMRKVYELDTFPGNFKDSQNKVYDARPRESSPCLSNFNRMEVQVLQRNLLKAYEGQLHALEASE